MKTGKLMAACLAAVMVCGAAVPFASERAGSLAAASADDFEYLADGVFGYNVYSDHVYVGSDWYLGAEQKGDIVIPSEYEGLPVTGIKGFSFQNNPDITSVTIPDTVTYIGGNAFTGCENLRNVYGGESLTEIEANVFEGTPWLDAQRSSGDYMIIGGVLVSANDGITEAVIPDGIKTVGGSAFSGRESLVSVTIPDSVETIDTYAFSGCTCLTEVVIPDSVTRVGRMSFSGCTSLRSLKTGSSVQTIEEGAFKGCTVLETVTAGDSFVSVGREAFAGTKWLEDAMETDPLVILGGALISGLNCEEDVVIPDGVRAIADSAFYEMDHFVIGDDGERIIEHGRMCRVESVTIPDSVTSIGERAFSDCMRLKKVNIPHSVSYIGSSAFSGCESLSELDYRASAATLEEDTFAGCASLTEVVLPAELKKVDKSVFAKCENLRSVTFLSPDCEFGESYTWVNDLKEMIFNRWGYDENDSRVTEYDGVIRGYSGSTAQEYAEKCGYTFEAVGSVPIALGDPNGDGKVDSKDASFILAEYSRLSTGAETEPLPTEIKTAADVNADGMLDAKDASAILGYYSYISTGGSGDMAAYMAKN